MESNVSTPSVDMSPLPRCLDEARLVDSLTDLAIKKAMTLTSLNENKSILIDINIDGVPPKSTIKKKRSYQMMVGTSHNYHGDNGIEYHQNDENTLQSLDMTNANNNNTNTTQTQPSKDTSTSYTHQHNISASGPPMNCNILTPNDMMGVDLIQYGNSNNIYQNDYQYGNSNNINRYYLLQNDPNALRPANIPTLRRSQSSTSDSNLVNNNIIKPNKTSNYKSHNGSGNNISQSSHV
eukprot:347587_1